VSEKSYQQKRKEEEEYLLRIKIRQIYDSRKYELEYCAPVCAVLKKEDVNEALKQCAEMIDEYLLEFVSSEVDADISLKEAYETYIR
jgi:hypothetical protein